MSCGRHVARPLLVADVEGAAVRVLVGDSVGDEEVLGVIDGVCEPVFDKEVLGVIDGVCEPDEVGSA